MKTVSKPVKEGKVLAPTKSTATAKQVIASMVAKGECCVDHLCGCE